MSMNDAQGEVAKRASRSIARFGATSDVAATVTARPELPCSDEPAGDDVADALPGQRDLDVLRLLGAGGMGRVLLARQPSLQREVAVKTVRPEILTPETSVALLEESRITGSLEHPNIVPVHALGVDDGGAPFLVMKRVDGVAWSELIEDPGGAAWARIPVREGDVFAANLEILVAVCDAAHFAHRHGVIHRDIKPANVMVGEFGEVYLVDWGVATALRPDDPRYRKDRLALVGTPCFMAPEMVNDDGGPVDARTDVYLLGATLHVLLTGRSRHKAPTLIETLHHAYVSAPVEYPATIPSEIGEIANRACDPDPAKRYADAAAFRDAVRGFLAHRGSITLSDNARARLEALTSRWADPSEDRTALRRDLTACGFGFAHALEVWPENARAREGVRACALLALRDDIARGNLVGAEAALLDAGEVPKEILDGVIALRAEVAAREARDARYRERERGEDWSRAAGLRLAFFLATAALGITLWLWANGWQVRYRGQLSPQRLAGTVGVALALTSAMIVAARKQLMTTRVNAQLVYGVLLAGCAMFANRVANLWPVPYSATLVSTELIFCALGAAIGGLTLARWLWRQVPVWLAGAFLVRARPEVAGMIFACSALLSLAIGVWHLHGPASPTDETTP